MTALSPTYVNEGGLHLAFIGDELVASGDDLEKVEKEAQAHVTARHEAQAQATLEEKKRVATHIVTPNGVKGKLLSRVPDLWGEKVVARLENGEIREFHTTGHETWEREASKTNRGVEGLRERLDAEYDHDKDALVVRAQELKAIRHEAGDYIIKGASYLDETQLDQIRVLADAELAEVSEALDYLNQVDDAIAPPVPQAVEQATVGIRDDGSTWLDSTLQEMVDENAGQDFEQLLDEGPTTLVSELDDGAIADVGTTREVALSHIMARTAGIESAEVDRYRDMFLARVEEERRVQLNRRLAQIKTETTEKVAKDENVPDESLFLS